MKLCECGCGREVNNRFIHGHQRIGKHLSDEIKKKISVFQKGRYIGKNSPHYGKHLSEETKEKLRGHNILLNGENHYNFGKHLSEEHKKKIGLGNIGVKNGMYGEHHNYESREKIRKNHKPLSINSSWGKYSVCLKGHRVRSSWERLVADWLFKNNVNYEYEKQRFFFYEISYLPDFYIPSLDLWIEVKGWMDPKSVSQIEWFLFEGNKLLLIDNVDDLDEILNFLL